MKTLRERSMTTPFSASIRNSFVCLLLSLPFMQVMQAQTAHFSGVVSTLGTFNGPYGVAVDGAGNVFVAASNDSAVYEIVAVNGVVSSSSTVKTVGSGFAYPSGVAVDRAGNVFVADFTNNAVKEIVAVNGSVSSSSTVNTVGSGFSNPYDVAVDSAGNVFVADSSNNAVKEIVAVNGLVSSSSTVNTVGSGFSYPDGVAVDSAGNVFVADSNSSTVKEIVAVNGLVSSSSTVNTVGSGFSYPGGVAVDSAGNVFVGDSYHNAIKEIVAVNGLVSSSSTVNTIGSGFRYPYGVAVDSAGNVFVADEYNYAVKEIMTRGVNFGSLPVATSTPTTLSLSFNFDTGGTLDAPAVLTQGISGLDFTDAGSGTCTTNGTSHSYSTGDSCTVNVVFTPQYPTARLGAVLFMDGSANVLATAYLDGVGVGSEIVFNPAITSVPLHSLLFSEPVALVVDGRGVGAGNVYIAEEGHNQILKVDPSGNVTVFAGTGVSGFSGDGGPAISARFNDPSDIVMDGAGNLYVADYNNSVVRKIDTKGKISTVVGIGGSYADGASGGLATATRLGGPKALTFDPQGNLYVVDYYYSKVRKVNQAGIITTVAGTGVAGYSGDGAAATSAKLNYPLGARTDSQGNLYISDTYNNLIRKVDSTGAITTVAGHYNGGLAGYGGDGGAATSATLNTPYDLAIDAAGELFICDSGNSVLRRVDASGNISTYGTPLSFPEDAVVDGAGNLALIDSTAKALVTISRTQPASLNFGTLNVGSTSSAQNVNVLNIGNTALTFPVPSTGLNPSISSGFSLSNSSTCSQISSSSNPATLAVGASCNELISFTPTVPGSVSGSLVITDDSLNAPGLTYGTQTIPLTGTATETPVTATTAIPSAALTQNYATTPFIPVTGSGGAGTLTYSVSPALPAGLSFSAAGTVSGTPTVVSTATTYTVTVTDTSSSTTTATFNLTVNTAIRTSTVDFNALTENHAVTTFAPIIGSGGTGTLSYSFSPSLPAGLVYSATGMVSGTPTVVSAATTYTVTVTDANGATRTSTFSLTVKIAITATTASSSTVLTVGHAATAFTPVTATGGSGRLTYSVSPTLPAGMSFSSTGTVSGTPTAVSAAATYTVTVTDTNGATGTATFSLTVDNAITASTTASSTVLTVGHAAAFTPVSASGGTGALTYSVSPALPAGLVFVSTGTVSGTPTAVSAATTYTVTATDSDGATGTATFSLTISAPVTTITAVASTILTQGHLAAAFTPVSATGGTGALTYSVSPALPAGLVFVSTGAVSGTPTAVSAATTYTVTVTDTNGATSTATFSLTVDALVTTSTAIASSSLTPTYGAMVVLTATVTPAPADTPPGTARFYTGSTLLGTVALNSTGVATLSIALPLGPNTITAVYSGSASDAGSTSSAISVSDRTGSLVTLSASPTTQLYNNPIVLTAQATSSTAGTLTGTVNFLDGTTVIATVPLGANGQATYSATTLADGSHNLTASYSGDPNFQQSGSTGAAVAITVGDVNLNLGGDQSQSVVPGAAVAYAFPLSPLVTPTFLYDVHLTATGLPPGATYTFSPVFIPAGSASLPVTLTVQTAKGTASLIMPTAPGRQNSSRGLTALAFGLLLPLFGAKSVRRRLKAMPKPLAMILFAVLSMGTMVGLSGCGGGGYFGATSTSGKYTITVTATSADLVRTSTVQLTIQ
jgi:sugar lactone lactonase YvrE